MANMKCPSLSNCPKSKHFFYSYNNNNNTFYQNRGIPSTFTGPHGSIKYYIEVINEEPLLEEGHRVGLFEFGVEAPNREILNVCYEFKLNFKLNQFLI